MKKAILVAGLALVNCGMQAHAQMKPPTPAEVAPLKNALAANFDRLFVLHASMGNKAEVALGKLAMMRSKNPDVLMIAKTTMTQHGMADRELTRHARTIGYPVPKDPGIANKATYNMLSKMRGAAFDKAYLAALVGGHEQTILLLQHEIEHGDNPRLRAHAMNKLTAVLGHASMIYTCAAKLNAPGIAMRPAPVKQAAMNVAMKTMDGMKMGGM